jgi:hypothetical protein
MKILQVQDSQDYHKKWENFEEKNKPETEYNVHSKKPVISKLMVYQTEPFPVMRSKVHQKKMREYDPYFTGKKYMNPFWHMQHYMMVAEQMGHAGANIFRGNSDKVFKDQLKSINIRKPTFWRNPNKHVSIELIIEELGASRKFLFNDNFYFTVYDDKTSHQIAKIHLRGYGDYRSYIKDIHVLESQVACAEKEEALERLIRKIDAQDVKQNQLLVEKREDLPKKEYMISELKNGIIPRDDLDNFFSLWDIA